MSLEIAARGKGHGTQLTRVRFLARVPPPVNAQIARRGKASATNVTMVRFAVHEPVQTERRRRGTQFITNGTFKLLTIVARRLAF